MEHLACLWKIENSQLTQPATFQIFYALDLKDDWKSSSSIRSYGNKIMTNVERYLITTADERTWKFDRPVIFLGEWCLLHERKQIWEKMDYIVASPYGTTDNQKNQDLRFARNIEEKLYTPLVRILNGHHELNLSQRSWKIILGHWLRDFTNTIINRTNTLHQCFENYRISGATFLVSNNKFLVARDTNEFYDLLEDAEWNSNLDYILIMKHLKLDIRVDCIYVDSKSELVSDYQANPFKPNCLKLWAKKFIRLLLRKLSRPTDAFIQNTYLPRREEVKLQLLLGQCPQFWEPIQHKQLGPARVDTRMELLKLTTPSNTNGIIWQELLNFLPTSYLENFNYYVSLGRRTPWPSNPKFIFTSNSFHTDEVFKIWAALKVMTGTKYYIGQHGNHYGTYRYTSPSVEEETADKFITWGWTDYKKQYSPGFVFKTVGKKGSSNKSGGLLLIESPVDVRRTTWDVTNEFETYFRNQKDFVSKLPQILRNELTIRLHFSSTNLSRAEEQRWREYDPSLQINIGKTPIWELIPEQRLVVYSYDSTGILESLSLNTPMLAFWLNGLQHVTESAKPYYQALVDVGIIHFNPDSAARKVLEVWDDVESWWNQSDLQTARDNFCNQYARTSERPIRDLRKIFMEVSM